MSPGSISELVLSDAIAFRVRFEGGVPPAQARYWRGPVLHDFDGHTWRRIPRYGVVQEVAEPDSPALRYQVMLEPHGRMDLFGLDAVAQIEAERSFRTFDGQFLSRRAIAAPIIYEGVSHLRMRHQDLSLTGRRIATQLPAERNPRSIALARQLRAGSVSDAQYAERVLDYLRTGGFEYTLTPPLLGRDSVDDLLFGSRLGFCGHFASAYTTLMRAAGIPARVVTGYLGGEWNPVGGYYIVRQSEAHAWTEVWLEGRGWVRIDPTAMIAPDRIQRGLSDVLPGRRTATGALLGDAIWWRDLRNVWDAAGSWWQERVVNFNSAAQKDLLARLGLDRLDYRGLAVLLGAGATLWALLLLVLLSRRATFPRRDPLGAMWERFIALLERRGVRIAPHDGPQAIQTRARRALPGAAEQIEAFVRDYARLRFGPVAAPPDRQQLRALRQCLRRIARATATRRQPGTARRWRASKAADRP